MFEYEVIKELMGKTLKSVQVIGDEEILFVVDDNESYRMHHEQDCCESVTIEDICGEMEWLVGSPILRAEERVNNEGGQCSCSDSETWTFYEIATLKGAVTIRWHGTSNGYYSESVQIQRVEG